jgi:antitoxin HicB
MATRLDYPFQVRPLTDEEGGGYLIEFRDLPGCLSDGETIEDAIRNGPDAVRSWIETAREFGDPVPPPSRASDEAYSGHWNMRVPKSLPRRLAERAKAAGVSLNTLAVTLLAEGWAARARRRSTGGVIAHSALGADPYRGPAPRLRAWRAHRARDQPRGDRRPDHRRARRSGGAGPPSARHRQATDGDGEARRRLVRRPWGRAISAVGSSGRGSRPRDGRPCAR